MLYTYASNGYKSSMPNIVMYVILSNNITLKCLGYLFYSLLLQGNTARVHRLPKPNIP